MESPDIPGRVALHALVNALSITRSRLSELSLFFIFMLLWTRTLLAALLTPRRKEGNRMPSPRWLARLAIPMMAGAALVSSAAIASANPADDAYLAKLRAVGLSWTP